jgi:EAL and modified HD-GYP domain-containing signal transduction protein
MEPNHILQSLIGYEPIIDRKRSVMGLRVRMQAPGGGRPSMATLYDEFAEDWPAQSHSVLLSASEAVLDGRLLEVKANPNVWLEVPAELTCLPEMQDLLGDLHHNGMPMVLRGRPPIPLPPHLLPAFRMSIIHVDEDRRLLAKDSQALPAGVKRTIGYAQDGVKTIELMERCFDTGAQAVLGWPMEDAMSYRDRQNSQPDYAAIMQLIAMADAGEDPPKMEAVIRRDPAIAYRLLRYINSVGFGLQVQVQSFRHAIMMLGYQKLKRWLALLLATSSKDANMRPVMLASFRRGLMLEQLLGEDQSDEMRDEVFILGVFSLLDKLMKKPFAELFDTLAVPERVHDTLVSGTGTYAPYLRIVEAIEQGPDPKVQDALDACLLTLADCNKAVLRTLRAPELANA